MDVYVTGIASHPPASAVRDRRLEEMVFETTRNALADAAVERDEVDHVAIAGCDELDGRSISSMLLAAPAGACLKDEIKVTDSGLTALCLGAMRVAAGLSDLCLVVSWSKPSIAPFEDVMRMRADPFFTRPIGLNASIADGLFASAVSQAFGLDEEQAARAVVDAYARARNHPDGLRHPVPSARRISESDYVAAPLRAGHQAPRSDGTVSVVLASGRWLARHGTHEPRARLAGLGWCSDNYQLGGARLTEMRAFRRAFTEALSRAGLDGEAALDVAELDSPTGYHELAYRHALAELDPERVSPAGGAFAQYPYFCSGLVNARDAIRQVQGEARDVQIPGARLAAAHGSHGYAQQGHVFAIFEGAGA